MTLANVLKFPNGRWAYHHLRELGPTANIWRGAKRAVGPAGKPASARAVAFADDKDQPTTIADWQKNTYTDALLVLHKGKIVYEKYHVGLRPEQPHVLWSMTKSFTGLLATMLIKEGKLDAEREDRAIPSRACIVGLGRCDACSRRSI